MNVGPALIKESSEEKLMGATSDKGFPFETHTQQLSIKANQKLQALARISPFVDSIKLVAITNAFVSSQFSYCPLTWMLHNGETDRKINRIHKRALTLADKDNVSTFEYLLAKTTL